MDKLIEIYGSEENFGKFFRDFCGEMAASEYEMAGITDNRDEFLADLFYKSSVPLYARGEMPLVMFTPAQQSDLLQIFSTRENLRFAYQRFVERRNGARPGEHLGQLFYDAIEGAWEEVG